MKYIVYHLRDRDAVSEENRKPAAVLELDSTSTASWSQLSPEFSTFGLPCCEAPRRYNAHGSLESLTPYSSEAMEYLAHEGLPSRGFFLSGPFD